MASTNDIRNSFLNFFKQNGHTILPSAPLVPHNDPTLMFTNAGMVPFKNVFNGTESITDRNGNIINRAASSQKCVRAGGKHNDLDNVGYTARHHTFFEMLGNFSFGDYFKEDAIDLAWEFLTKIVELPKDKLYITVYHTDDEAFDIWKKVTGFSDKRIIRISTNDNFWAMGNTGPCGPCSEIFYDHGDEIKGGLPGTPDEDGDRFVEIWNLVFMQYEQLAENGGRINLPKPSIDTGMGLERMAAILQGKHNNYDIDLFQRLIAASKQMSGNDDEKFTASHNIIADHLRSCSFLLADGVLPSNEGRGYVLRRIMRRAMRHAHILGAKEPLLYKLVPNLVSKMGGAFPELERGKSLIEETLKLEEERFRETLSRGLNLLEAETEVLESGDSLDGNIAFKLYDTFGFPLDLTEDILRGKNMTVDNAGFDTAMEKQKATARAAWSGSGEKATDDIWFDLKDEYGATEFIGYDLTDCTGKIIAIIKDGEKVDAADNGDIFILTNQTSFYAESGGQAGDYGIIKTENGELSVSDTKKQVGSLHVHICKIINGKISVGDLAYLKVDAERRNALKANHSATHLLHAALHKLLGDHVTQKGSLVEGGYFRFDFNYQKGLSAKEITSLEMDINRAVRMNSPVTTRIMPPDEAIKHGAMALFGEKYGDEVRVVSMGSSVELCGGTHVDRTGDIGLFKIKKESAVAAGIRRIEAVTGENALEYINGKEKIISDITNLLKTPDIKARLESLLEEKKKLERELTESRKKSALSDENEKIGDITFMAKKLDGVPAKELRGFVDEFKKNTKLGVAVIISNNNGKASIVVGVTDDLTNKITAVDLVRKGSEALGGKGGGGRPDFAQAGGSNADNADAAILEIKKLL